MHKLLLALAVLLFSSVRLVAQPPRFSCSCPALLDEAVGKVTTVYAGFDDKVTPRTRPRYRQLLARLRREAPLATTARGCYDVIQRYADFFRDSHVGAWFGVQSSPGQQRVVRLTTTRTVVPNTPTTPAGLEGVWATADTTQRYAITRDPARRDAFVAVTLATADSAWRPGMVKAEFYQYEPRLGFYRGMYYRSDFSGVLDGLTLHADRIDHWFGPSWYRQGGAGAARVGDDGQAPYVQFKVLSAQFAYVRFARFDQQNVHALDSLLATNRAVLAEMPNLIVDLRGNPGGDASSSDAMIRLIYTNPIVYPAWQYRSSPELIASTRAYLATLKREPSKNGWIIERQERLLARLLAHPGQLVGGDDISRRVDSVGPLPNRVAFLIDGRTGSSAEFFVFLASSGTALGDAGRASASAHGVTGHDLDEHAAWVHCHVPGACVLNLARHPAHLRNTTSDLCCPCARREEPCCPSYAGVRRMSRLTIHPPPIVERSPRPAGRVWWMVGSFAAMYVIATILGFGTYLLISPTAMWICVFTLMPVVAAYLIYWYLRAVRVAPETSLAESAHLVLVWIGLSFALDALTYVLIVPAATHTPPNWTFFRDQSPWIWLSYAALVVSGGVGRWAYLRSRAA